jgi:hypothetical protein
MMGREEKREETRRGVEWSGVEMEGGEGRIADSRMIDRSFRSFKNCS